MESITKEEKKELRRQEWQAEIKKQGRKKKWPKFLIWLSLPILLIGGFWLLLNIPQGNNSNNPEESLHISPISNNDITLGTKDAKVKLIEYADFQCPGCRNFHTISKKLEHDYGNKILYVYRFFPLPQIHKNAMISAQAAYAAYLQNKFWEMNDALFDNQDAWATQDDPTQIFTGYAKDLGLDVDKFKQAMKDGKTKKIIEDFQAKGLAEGVNHTPTVIINGTELTESNYDGIKNIINAQLGKK